MRNHDLSVERSRSGGTSQASGKPGKFVSGPQDGGAGHSAGPGSALSGAEGPGLVINTNLASALHCKDESEWNALQWGRLRIAQRLLWSSDREKSVSRRPKGAKVKVDKVQKLSESRTAGCFWKAVAFSVEHWKVTRADGVGAYVRSVLICGSRSACPRCSMKIWLADRVEIQAALVAVNRLGWEVQHVAYTVSHKRKHKIAVTLPGLRRANQKMRSGRKFQELKKRYGIEGAVTITENTFSLDNGHHPHMHEGVFTNRILSDAERESMRDELAELWLDALGKVGLSADYEISVTVNQGQDNFADYVSKWGHEPQVVKPGGLSYELTSFHTKTKGAEHGHYTMLQLLDLAGLGEKWAGDAWLDFVQAFEGRAMIRWGVGLREKLGLPLKTRKDQDKAKQLDQGEKKIFALYHHKKHWLKVRENLPSVLEASKVMGFDEFKAYLNRRGLDAESPVFELVDAGFGKHE